MSSSQIEALTCKVSSRVKKEVVERARARGIPTSELIRGILTSWLSKVEPEREYNKNMEVKQ